MGEYRLPLGNQRAALDFASLGAFERGYITAAFWTDAGPDAEGDLSEAGFADLAPEALESILDDCGTFQADNRHLLALAYSRPDYDAARGGVDFWLTRNGHGAGFWDRGLGEVGDALAARCGWRTDWPERALYRGDCGRVWHGPG